MTESLSASHALAIVDNCPFPLLVLDNKGRVSGYNSAFEYLVGTVQAAELQGRALAALGNHPARMLLSTEKTISWHDGKDHEHHFEIHCVDLPHTDHAQARFFIDISKHVHLQRAHNTINEELRQQTLTDSLTGLLNQRGVMLALEPQVARSRRYNSPISVIMMDIQTILERESVLVHIARLLKDQLRWADLIGCNEQHEFILVLPETLPEAALKLADKLEQGLQQLVRKEFAEQAVSTCYGITGWRKSDNATTLLKRASMALSEAQSEYGDHAIAL